MAAPKARRNTAFVAAFLYLLTIPFLILVLIGNTSNSPVIRDTWFFKLDISQVIPIQAAGDSGLLNSVVSALGLHDFYQAGLWSFCEGYNGEGITYCSDPKPLYWFNPVEILVGELFAGAQIPLPSQVFTVLTVLRIGLRLTFGFFLTGIILNFLIMLVTPLATRTRWWSLGLSIAGFLSALLITVAAIIATAISVAFKIAATAQDQLNIKADIGIRMVVYMWIAAIATDIAFILHAAMGCCCKPERRQKNRLPSPEGAPSEKKKRSPGSILPFRRKNASKSSASE